MASASSGSAYTRWRHLSQLNCN